MSKMLFVFVFALFLIASVGGSYVWNDLDDGFPSGMIIAMNGSTCPQGWNLADGTDGTPDLRGIYIRGSGVNSKLNWANGTDISATQGEYQNDMFQSHKHSYNVPAYNSAYYNIQVGADWTLVAGTSGLPITSGADTGAARIGAETRPPSYVVTYCIKL